MKLKILSWNIWDKCKFDLVADFFKNQDADIICLQEVLLDDPSRDVVGLLKSLGYQSEIATAAEFPHGDKIVKLNNAVFSKFPIIEHRSILLREGFKNTALQTKIEIENQELSVFSLHLKHTHQEPSPDQNDQADSLIKALPEKRVVVMGDFNALPKSYPIEEMRKKLTDSDPEQLPTWSVYPEGCPMKCLLKGVELRLDYIFVSRDIKISSPKVESSKGSDHLPISAVIEI